MRPVPFFHRFSFKIIVGLVSMLCLVVIPFFLAFLQYHRNQLLETVENLTTSMGRTLAHQLEVSALERRNHQLSHVVERLAADGDVRNIMVVDSAEKVMVSSDPSQLGHVLVRGTEPGCRECHSSMVLKQTIRLRDPEGRTYYRSVSVIQNRPACYSCHTSRSSINGILVMDFSQNALESQFRSGLFWLLGMGGTMFVLTIGVSYAVLNHLVLRRLRNFADVAEQIGQARFDQVAISGDDEFSRLAESFNLMSQRLASAMNEIQGARDYLDKVINNIDDEIIVLNRDFEVVTANAAHFGKNPGAEHEHAMNTPLTATSERHRSETCACGATFRDGRSHKIVQTALERDGREKHIEVFCSPLRNAAGEVYQVIEVRRDITERKLLEANLAHSERLISMGMLASGLSHEINNPLASISTFVEGLQRRLEKGKGSSQQGLKGLDASLGLIQREIERAKDVTRRLLVLAQKDEHGRTLVNLRESLEETVMLVRHEANKRGMQIDLDLAADIPTLKLSESQVRQVFLNLLLNSLQAGSHGGRILCRAWRDDGHVLASVEDDGHGIEPEDMVKIFEPFFSKKTPGQGTGLGLFICKTIVSSWGGSIAAENVPGRGARFTVSIPARS